MQDDGFTLLEMLVAIFVMLLLIVPFSDVISRSFASWELSNEKVTEFEEVWLARQHLRRWVKEIYPFDYNIPRTEGTYRVRGTSDQITFVSAAHPNSISDEKLRLELSVDEDTVNINIRPDFFVEEEEPETRSLLEGVSALNIQYFNPVTRTWDDEWENDGISPKALKFEVSFEEPKKRWPPLVIPIVSESWGFCQFDPVSLNCRAGAVPL